MKLVFIIGFCLIVYSAIAQEKEIYLIENSLIDGEAEEEQLENENILEDLILLKSNPININDTLADYSILLQYDLISPLQVEQIKQYLKSHGNLITKKELIAVNHLSYSEAKELMPFITVGTIEEQSLSFKDQFLLSKKSLVFRSQYLLEEQRGFRSIDSIPPKYQGNRSRLYFKYRQQFRDRLSIGLLGDKDAGEYFFSADNKQGFDFYSAHLYYKPKSKVINQVLLGDYEIKIGQGLMQWNGFALGKGSDATTVFLKGPRIRPYTSANEYNYLRGATTEVQISKKLKGQFWYSNKRLDANIEALDTIDNDFREITSLQTSGLHRTVGEIEDKNTIRENIVGANIDYENKWFKVGLASQKRKLDNPIKYSGRDHQQFYSRGDNFHNTSLHYSGLKNNLYFFGETAINEQNALATINGIQKFFGSGVKTSLVYRNYGKSYQSFYANSLSENTTVNNEEGLYFGLSYSPINALKIQIYYDAFRFKWNRARVDKPSNGNEWFLRADYYVGNSEIEFRTRVENKDNDIIGNTAPNNETTNQKRISNRFEIRHRPNAALYLKTRVAHTAFETSQKNENGFLLFQDVVYDFPQYPIKLYTRLASFHTPSYDSRIYAYENDLLYNFSVPAYYGKGIRYYGMVSISPIDDIKIWAKASQTIFNDQNTISSGNDEIDGNKRTDFKIQLQWKF